MESSLLSHALTTLLIFLQFTTYMNSCLANTQYVKNSCSTTTYPKLCYTSLSTYANKIQKSPHQLVTTALYVTLSATRSTSATIKNLTKIHGLKPTEAEAMADCVEQFGDSVDELQKSIKEMAHMGGGSKSQIQINDIQTWVSAALTDDDTCMDGLNGQVKTIVHGDILRVAHLTSNALALFNNYVAI